MIQKRHSGFRDRTQPFEGLVEIWVHANGQLVDFQRLKNIVLFQGNTEVIRTLCTITPGTAPRVVTRMAIGDQGAIPSDPTIPKVPVKTATGLYHELYRKDVDSSIKTLYSTVALTYTGNTTIGTNTLTNLSSTTGVVKGMAVSGTGIPAGTIVSAVLTSTSVQVSNNSTSTNTGTSINFIGTVNECQFTATFDSALITLSAYSNPSQPRVNEVSLIIIDPTAGAGISRAPVVAPASVPSDEVVMTLRTFKSVPFEIANNTTITIRYTIFTE